MSKAELKKGDAEWVNFELGEDVRDEVRLKQDQEWSSAVADGRAHVSHREMAMLNAPQLCLAISDYELIEELVSALENKHSILQKISSETLRHIIEFAFPEHGTLVTSSVIRRKLEPLMETERAYSNSNGNEFPFRICLRKRPMMPYEHEFGAYDVCTIDTKNGLTLHEGRLARNGRQLSMTHHQFVVDRVYNDTADNQTVCLDAVEPLISWAETGHTSTLLCFGQTGTGKTYTLYGALEYISTRLIDKCIRITFYEVHGKKCYDLLKNRNIVHLRSDAHENMHVRGAVHVELLPLQTPSELLDVLHEALTLRSSKVTERNPISSRSHAVCTIEILDHPLSARSNPSINLPNPPIKESNHPIGPPIGQSDRKDRSLGAYLSAHSTSTTTSTTTTFATSTSSASSSSHTTARNLHVIGKITLVDLAGSERNYDTTKMTSAQHLESADINFALMALKDCFRSYHAQLTSHLTTLDERLQQKLKPGEGGNKSLSIHSTPNLFTSTTNTTGVVNTIHHVGGIAGTKTTALPVQHNSSESNNYSEQDCTRPLSTTTASTATTSTTTRTSTGSTSSSASTIRIPFRSSTLTKVLKECFTSGPHHRTTIMATISPTPIDLQHSLNTLNHIVLMCPELQQLTHRVTVDVQLNLHLQMQNRFNAKLAHNRDVGSGLSIKPLHTWSSDDVILWLTTAERGRFKYLVLPSNLDGKGLLQLSENNMIELFAKQHEKIARNEKEGNVWIETVENTRQIRILGRALWRAVRHELRSIIAREKQNTGMMV